MSKSLITKSLFALIAGAALVAGANSASAGPEVNTSTGIVTVDGKPAAGLAVHGYDVVAYFTDGHPMLGNATFAYTYEDATYRFASQEHLDMFKADAARYVPEFGGFCAYGVSVGAKFDGDPTLWKIVDGKLYLNLDAGIQAAWLKDVPGAIQKANTNWPGIASKLPSEIN